jgi:hypothetical protein
VSLVDPVTKELIYQGVSKPRGTGGIDGRGGFSRYTRSKSTDPFGNEVITVFDKKTGDEEVASFGNGDTYTREEAERRGGERAGQAGAEAGAKQQAKVSVDRIQELGESGVANAKGLNAVDQAINALEGGAGAGSIENKMPLWMLPNEQQTALLREARDSMALEKIGEFTFGSLSEAEGNWLKGTQMPDLDEDELLPYYQHKREGMIRASEATEYEREKLQAGEAIDPKVIQHILRSGGYNMSEYGYR